MVDVNWLLFVIASTAVICMPGQDLILVLTRSLSQGALAGAYTSLGVSAGLLVHTLLATVGVGALVTASELLFNIMKWMGAIYLLYLGIIVFRTKAEAVIFNTVSKRSNPKLFLDGAISNIANPKIAIFFFAFLPQFINPSSTNTPLSIFVLGIGFAFLTFVIKGSLGYFSGQLSARIRQKPHYLTRTHQVSGIVLIAMGLKLAFEQHV